jgi:hypothetical protein
MLLQGRNEISVETRERLQQRLPTTFGAGMNQQIAIDGATDLHAIGAESQLGRYADRLAVAALEHATGNGLRLTAAARWASSMAHPAAANRSST